MTIADDPFAPDLVHGLDGPLATFNAAGILSAADVHAARRLAHLTGCTDDVAALGAAFAVRAPRFGHVHADLAVLATTVTDEDGRVVPVPDDAWPDTAAWVAALTRSPLVAGPDGTAPLHLDGTRLYLDRYWRHEQRAAAAIAARTTGSSSITLSPRGRSALPVLFADNADQAAAARAVLDSRLAVIAGGPGTGKTATVARIVGLAARHATAHGRPLRMSISAPTGKAAARLAEALRDSAATADPAWASLDLFDPAAATAIAPTTLHRLLGGRRGRTRFRHDADNPLPHDLVVVDEVSMVSLALLTRLLEALRPDATLVLVGDPDQLAAVEAGTVLGDIIDAAASTPLGAQVVTLRHNYRSDRGISDVADLLRAGRADEALAAMVRNPEDPVAQPISLVVPDQPGTWPHGTGPLTGIRTLLEDHARLAISQATAGETRAALDTTMSVKILCAHRRGPDGVRAWNGAVEGWATDLPPWHRPEWYPGRPVMASRNDYDLDVYNGDIGVVVADGDSLRVAVDGRDAPPVEHRRLGEVQTVHAMTVHKSQGSQFTDVIVVLPHEPSPILTRELLYTAVTRAKRSVTVIGTEDAVRRAVDRTVSRASGLADQLQALLGPGSAASSPSSSD